MDFKTAYLQACLFLVVMNWFDGIMIDSLWRTQQENNNTTVADEVDPELLAKILANPEIRALLNSLEKTMK